MQLKEGKKLKVGALGDVYFDEGFYAYTGSALGAGGFSRIRRHLEVASGKNATRQWHIDYLLPYVDVLETITSARPECTVAVNIGKTLSRVSGFGCSDCTCLSHLHYSRSAESMDKAVRHAHRV